MSAQERQALLVRLFTEYLRGEHTQGQLLHYLRKNVLRFNQTQFAELVGVSRRTLSDIELDKASPAQNIVDKVFKPFGLKAGIVPAYSNIVDLVLAQNKEDSK